jgi:hypothetical protein
VSTDAQRDIALFADQPDESLNDTHRAGDVAGCASKMVPTVLTFLAVITVPLILGFHQILADKRAFGIQLKHSLLWKNGNLVVGGKRKSSRQKATSESVTFHW